MSNDYNKIDSKLEEWILECEHAYCEKKIEQVSRMWSRFDAVAQVLMYIDDRDMRVSQGLAQQCADEAYNRFLILRDERLCQ